ncbi:MAG: hypothetical protein Q7J77_05045 [Undibacterium sp.]|nr:hypothetical protein [Undibacterium sp.]
MAFTTLGVFFGGIGLAVDLVTDFSADFTTALTIGLVEADLVASLVVADVSFFAGFFIALAIESNLPVPRIGLFHAKKQYATARL